MNPLIQSVKDYAKVNYKVLILANGKDQRASTFVKWLANHCSTIECVIIINYSDEKYDVSPLFPTAQIAYITVNKDAGTFINEMKHNLGTYLPDEMVIDITCIRIPELFYTIKLMSFIPLPEANDSTGTVEKITNVAYSIPYDYEFSKEPFTSFRTYYGNLQTNELIGYGGLEMSSSERLVLFLGFEGTLASKIVEETEFRELMLVNCIPSFFPKYKDTCVVNNYEIFKLVHEKLSYVPADNPFETYNFLKETLSQFKGQLCISPLATKPVALGVCLFALRNQDSVRVVYPTSNSYNVHSSNDVLDTILFQFPVSSEINKANAIDEFPRK